MIISASNLFGAWQHPWMLPLLFDSCGC